MSKTIESRATKSPVAIQKRSDGKAMLVGYGAVFYNPADAGTQYEMWEECYERIMPGAFDRALREMQDVRCLRNHQPDSLLGRVASGTLRLSIDNRGLKYECDLPDNTLGNDTKVSLERGDLDGSSFSFQATRCAWIYESKDGEETSIRQIEDVDLYDVGPVTFPAYTGATAGMRSESRAGLEAELIAERSKQRAEADAVDMAATMARLECEAD